VQVPRRLEFPQFLPRAGDVSRLPQGQRMVGTAHPDRPVERELIVLEGSLVLAEPEQGDAKVGPGPPGVRMVDAECLFGQAATVLVQVSSTGEIAQREQTETVIVERIQSVRVIGPEQGRPPMMS